MALPGFIFFARCSEPLKPELAHGLQHQIARLIVRTEHLTQQALLDESDDAVENGKRSHWSGHCLCRLQSEATSKDGKMPEHPLLLGCEQVIAPGDGVAHRAL